MTVSKQKILEIFITALIGAGIAFLTNLLGELSHTVLPHASPEMAGVLSAAIKSVRSFSCHA